MLLVEETEMGVATTLEEYLVSRAIAFDVIEHPHTNSAMRAAEAAHVPGDQVAKPVLLGDEHSYLLAVIPATHRLELDRLNQMLARSLEMLPEEEVEATFSDCERGAIPAIGDAYGVDVVIDPILAHQDDVYFESGDHEHLIHMRGDVFRGLMEHVPRAPVSHHL
ncbi:MAG: YbaK/EbsC family protein [Gammaproteobacteria bacterium]|nr:YbaK/EbsC family protein [Gammaproteobacteria bacterium]MCP5298874.1 YbaK/EbsC family protein [Chromatiaceae bacterium]